MKRFALIASILCMGMTAFCQTRKPIKASAAKEDSLTKAAAIPAPSGLDPNVTIFVLSPDQVKLLEYVISSSEAGYHTTQQLIQILQTQQTHPPRDTTQLNHATPREDRSWKKPQGDSTVKKN